LHLGEASIVIMAVAALIGTVGVALAAWFFVNGGMGGLGIVCTIAALIGLFVLTVCWVVLPAMVVEQIGPVAGIVRSWQLTQGRRWQILAVIFIFAAIEFAIGYVFSNSLVLQFGALGVQVPLS